jgi:hypothetical protein
MSAFGKTECHPIVPACRTPMNRLAHALQSHYRPEHGTVARRFWHGDLMSVLAENWRFLLILALFIALQLFGRRGAWRRTDAGVGHASDDVEP